MINLGDYRRFSTVLNYIVLKHYLLPLDFDLSFSTMLNNIVLKL